MTQRDLVTDHPGCSFDYRHPADIAEMIGMSLFPEDVLSSAPRSQRDFLEAFQRRAVDRGLEMMRNRGGFMLCDSVGLGKSFVALELMRIFASNASGDVVVICPASSRSQWATLFSKYLDRVGSLSAGAASFHPVLLTHTQLSRGRYAESIVGRPGLVIVDEAHAFRAPATRRYQALRRITASRRVCLLTATPINNSLSDLYHLLRIWAPEHAFSDLGISHLKTFFAELAQEPTAPIAFRRLLRETMIRRSRDEIRTELRLQRSRLRFPHLAPPVAIECRSDVALDRSVSCESVLRSITNLDLSAMGSSADLLRFLLLKRLDSSPAALAATIRRLLRFHREFVHASDEGFQLTPGDLRAFGSDGTDTQLMLRHVALRPLAPSTDIEAVRHAALLDIALLENILSRTRTMVVSDDKLLQLRRLVTTNLVDRQLLIFSEFRETAEYLWRELVQLGCVALVHGGGARLGLNHAGRHTVIERFDRSGRPTSRARLHLREHVRILIATDVLAEGLNLQSCADVLSYDLPWNPVRLMQRIGRVDRIGSPHDIVRAYNFVPDSGLEDRLLLMGRLRSKIHAIELALGAERPVLAETSAFTVAIGGATSYDRCHDRVREWLRHRTRRSRRTTTAARAPGQRDFEGWGSRIPVAWIERISEWPDLPGEHSAAFESEPLILFAIYARARVLTAVVLFPEQHTLVEIDPVFVAGLCLDARTRMPSRPACLDERLARAMQQLRPPVAFAHSHRRQTSRPRRFSVSAGQKILASLARPDTTAIGGKDPPTSQHLARAEKMLLRLGSRVSYQNRAARLDDLPENHILALVAVGNDP
jgi:superfamily II DNA or RNA helicase